MDRTHGRCASGKRADGPVPHGHWLVTTLTAADKTDPPGVASSLQASDLFRRTFRS